MYICMYTYKHTYIHIYKHTYMHTYILYAYMRYIHRFAIYKHVCTYIYIYIYIYIYPPTPGRVERAGATLPGVNKLSG